MKPTIVSILFITLLLVGGCKEDDVDPTEETPCTLEITEVKVEQKSADFLISWESNEEAESYIIAYHATGSNPELFPNKISVEKGDYLFVPIEDLVLVPNGLGWYNATIFYVGAVCSNGNVVWSEDSYVIQVDDFVPRPRKLSMDYDNYVFSWEDTLDYPITRYIIEYGEKGFKLGNGISFTRAATTQTREEMSGFKMVKDSTYDFYVRAIKDGGESSSWAGPLTVKARAFVNICPKPFNVEFDFKYANPRYADVTFENYGYKFVYWKSVAKGDDPDLFAERLKILSNGSNFSEVILP
ncbi:MAG: fibronectin type III domain-containing protein, partial [Bacteroidia bacterium]